jgi:hypothetical protein
MKKLILLALTVIIFASCRKTKITVTGPSAVGKDTIPDGASFTLQMRTDSDGYEYPSTDTIDVTMHFNHAYHRTYSLNNGEDGDASVLYATWHWQFAALSDGGGQLSLDGVPYKPGLTIPISFTPSSNAQPRYFALKAGQLVNIPDDIHIWCKDNYLKDSIDLRKQQLHFHIQHTDTTTYGIGRFKIVVEPY